MSCAAADLLKDAARAVGGGGGGKGDVATAGGKNVEALDLALSLAREAAIAVMGSAQ
jgi:alanyl-tRNA synthetase